MKKKIDLQIRETGDYELISNEIMDVFSKYTLNYVEALGVVETLRAEIFAKYMSEDED